MNDRPNPRSGSGGRSLLTSRALILLTILGLTVIASAIPAKQYLEQRDRIHLLMAQKQANEETIAKLQSEVARWQDPMYVKAQVRERLHYVMPSEVGYIVLEADTAAVAKQYVVPPTKNSQVWYSLMWQSLESAGDTVAPAGKK